MTPLQRNHRHIARELRPAATNVEISLKFDGFDVVVRGDYQPCERMSATHPGCRADFDVTEVYLVDSAIDVSELFDAKALAIAVLDHMRKESAACEEIT